MEATVLFISSKGPSFRIMGGEGYDESEPSTWM
jgi:hypothetical protein